MSLQLWELRSLGAIGQGDVWTYRTEDDVTVGGYFAGAAHLLGVGDIIHVTVVTGLNKSDEAWVSSVTYVVTAGTEITVAGGSAFQYPMAVFDGDYLWNDPDTNTAWTASDTTSCTLVAEIRTPALPTGADWTLVGVGASGGAPHPRAFLKITSAGEIYAAAHNSDSPLALYAGITTDAALVPDTRYMIHAVCDTTATGDEFRIWVNGVEKAVTVSNPSGLAVGSDVLNWSSTAPATLSGGRRGSVGIQINAFGTGGSVVAASRVGYIDGGSLDVPVEIGLGFFSTAAITDPAEFYGSAGVDLSAYAATVPLLLGHTETYDVAAWAAGRNDGTGPDLTVGP